MIYSAAVHFMLRLNPDSSVQHITPISNMLCCILFNESEKEWLL